MPLEQGRTQELDEGATAGVCGLQGLFFPTNVEFFDSPPTAGFPLPFPEPHWWALLLKVAIKTLLPEVIPLLHDFNFTLRHHKVQIKGLSEGLYPVMA